MLRISCCQMRDSAARMKSFKGPSSWRSCSAHFQSIIALDHPKHLGLNSQPFPALVCTDVPSCGRAPSCRLKVGPRRAPSTSQSSVFRVPAYYLDCSRDVSRSCSLRRLELGSIASQCSSPAITSPPYPAHQEVPSDTTHREK